MAETNTSIQERVEALLDRGLRNLWYPVLPSYRVQDAPVGITRLGENIAVWRDRDGSIHALEDRCPHRGARLSKGWNLGNRLACWYHGVETDATGTVVDVPAVETSPLKGRRCVKSYPAKEAKGAIFLYFGDEAHADPCELTFPEELTSEEYDAFLCTAMWECNYRYAVDNVMDPMHGSYLHAKSHSMAFGDKKAEMKVRNTPTGLVFEKTGQRGVNFDWVEWGETGAHWMRLSIPYRPRYGPGGPFGIVGFATPIDETHCQVFFWRTRKVQGWQRDVWRFLYKNRLEGLHWEVLEQDHVVLENLAPEARRREFLYQHDAGLVRIRRMLVKQAEDQVKALDEFRSNAQPAKAA
jgi:phenylpropionate dioxygenase-like ring-hydroxylating dioxygenase large terminal subunit